MKHQQGMSLIELIAFIVIIGIAAGGLLLGLSQHLTTTSTPASLLGASFLANARMEAILMQRGLYGFSQTYDPCQTTNDLCTRLQNYANSEQLTVPTPTIEGSNPKTITVTVTGKGEARLSTRVYNYANN